MRRPLSVLIQEIEYEIQMRLEVYPRRVARRMMRQGEMDEKIERMRDVLETLRDMQTKESSNAQFG